MSDDPRRAGPFDARPRKTTDGRVRWTLPDERNVTFSPLQARWLAALLMRLSGEKGGGAEAARSN